MSYNPWPNGQVPLHLQRKELIDLKGHGFEFNDAREVVGIFEQKLAEFAGSKYAVAVDCCTHAMELSFRYLLKERELYEGDKIILPDNTYVSCYWMLKQLGFEPVLATHTTWSGEYMFKKWGDDYDELTWVTDGAVRWKRGMYDGGFHCLSFQIKKMIPIGRGGAILTDDEEAHKWLKLASYDGRDLNTPYDSERHVSREGWHYYMTPEDAARGLILMSVIETEGDTGSWENYPSITKMLGL